MLIRQLLVLSLILSTCAAASAQTTSPRSTGARQKIAYKSFKGDDASLYPWKGKHVMVLTSKSDYDPKVMAKIVKTLDQVHDFYAGVTGREPARLQNTIIDNHMTVATIDNTCGAGCGYVGATGIELMNGTFDSLYKGVRDRNEYDQAVFYEFGRNFFFYNDKINYKPDSSIPHASDNSVLTGYAVFMRFLAMEAAGAKGSPFGGRTFDKFRADMESLVDSYEADPKLNWKNTLRIDRAPANPPGFNGTDLFASFLFRLRRDYGGNAFVQKLWRAVAACPKAATTQDAVDNFVKASSLAANRNLVERFTVQWKWPLSDKARAEINDWRKPQKEKTERKAT